VRCIEGMYSYRKDDRWRSKLRPRKAPDALTSFLSQSLHERPHRKLSLLRYTPLDVRLSCISLCRQLKGTLFLPVFFFSFHTRSRSLLDSFCLYHFISQFLSFFCQLYLLIKLILSNMIFSYCSNKERWSETGNMRQLMRRSKYIPIHLCISCLSFMFHCSSIKMLASLRFFSIFF